MLGVEGGAELLGYLAYRLSDVAPRPEHGGEVVGLGLTEAFAYLDPYDSQVHSVGLSLVAQGIGCRGYDPNGLVDRYRWLSGGRASSRVLLAPLSWHHATCGSEAVWPPRFRLWIGQCAIPAPGRT